MHYNTMKRWEEKYADILRPQRLVIDNIEQVRIPEDGVENLLSTEEFSVSRRAPRSNRYPNNPTAQTLASELDTVSRKNAELALRNAELEAEAKGLREQVSMLQGFIDRIDRTTGIK